MAQFGLNSPRPGLAWPDSDSVSDSGPGLSLASALVRRLTKRGQFAQSDANVPRPFSSPLPLPFFLILLPSSCPSTSLALLPPLARDFFALALAVPSLALCQSATTTFTTTKTAAMQRRGRWALSSWGGVGFGLD